ncbi:hypothetical protein Zmor_014638 [Zophobas morio]|uniref:Uncharacterized protein n=1 Tax=Zophobas morio TaxID=2755281 RepID=A0AA38IGH2_9CUCU|nr:hypothetical protein Zmor_014638 [Zophobas morio]
MGFGTGLVVLLVVPWGLGQVWEIVDGLNKVTDFGVEFYGDLNFDGVLGFVIAEAQLLQSVPRTQGPLRHHLTHLINKCQEIRKQTGPLLPTTPPKMPILQEHLLDPTNWILPTTFTASLPDLGIYQNWTALDIVDNKSASYRGVPSDHCLLEILAQNCHMSRFCADMMVAPRIDTGYLLSHRLLYLQIVRLKQCSYDDDVFRALTKRFCSLMLKEVRTSEVLGFPAHDIVLEQMTLCGLEGYSDFLSEKWRREVLEWQSPFGCYHSEGGNLKRSSNVIGFGCTDHSTGLGAAAMAVNLRFLLQEYPSIP